MLIGRWARSPSPEQSEVSCALTPLPYHGPPPAGKRGTQLEPEVTELPFDPYLYPTGCVTLYKLLDLSETKMIPESKVAVALEVRH